MGGEKSGPGWAWVLGTPGGLRWAEYGGGYADPEGCRTDFPPSPAPGRRGPPAPLPTPTTPETPALVPSLADHSLLPCTRLSLAGPPRLPGPRRWNVGGPCTGPRPLLPPPAELEPSPAPGPGPSHSSFSAGVRVWGTCAPGVRSRRACAPRPASRSPLLRAPGLWAAAWRGSAQAASGVDGWPLQRMSHCQPPSRAWPCAEMGPGARWSSCGWGVGRCCSGSWGAALPEASSPPAPPQAPQVPRPPPG